MGIVLMPSAISDEEIVEPITIPGGTAYAVREQQQSLIPSGAVHLTDYFRLGAISWSNNFTSENIMQGITAAIHNGQTNLKTVIGSAIPAAQIKMKQLTINNKITGEAAGISGIHYRQYYLTWRWKSGNQGHATYYMNNIFISPNDLDGIDPKFVYVVGGGNNYYIGGGLAWSESSDGSTAVDRGMLLGGATGRVALYYLFSDNTYYIHCSENDGISIPVQFAPSHSTFYETSEYYVTIFGV